MSKKAIVYVAIIFVSFSFFMFPASVMCQQERSGRDKIYYREEGLKHFREGFNNLAPKGRKAEAFREYLLAIKAFKEALRFGEDEETRLNLAKVYYVQHNYAMAAAEYQKASELDPYRIETYVELALAYMHLKRYDLAIETLETAKTWTTDEEIIEKLDGYIHTAEEVRDGKEGTNDD